MRPDNAFINVQKSLALCRRRRRRSLPPAVPFPSGGLAAAGGDKGFLDIRESPLPGVDRLASRPRRLFSPLARFARARSDSWPYFPPPAEKKERPSVRPLTGLVAFSVTRAAAGLSPASQPVSQLRLRLRSVDYRCAIRAVVDSVIVPTTIVNNVHLK